MLRTVIVFSRAVVLLAVTVGACLCAAVSAGAETTPRPGYHLFGYFEPTLLPPGNEASVVILLYNTGAAESSEPVTITDALPAGAEANQTTIQERGIPCTGVTVVTCSISTPAVGGDPNSVLIPLLVRADATNTPGLINHITATGPSVLEAVEENMPVRYGSESESPGLGFQNVSAWVSNADGTPDTQAGSHPYEFNTTFAVNVGSKGGLAAPAGGEASSIDVNLPPGLVGEPGATPRCSRQLFDAGGKNGEVCPADTQIGLDRGGLGFVPPVDGFVSTNYPFAIYNLVPPPGVAAEFGFTYETINVFIDARVRSGGDYGITAHSSVPQKAVLWNSATIWGTPADPSHDSQRTGSGCVPTDNGCGSGLTPKPLLTLPTSCENQPVFSLEMLGTFQDPLATAPPIFSTYQNNAGEPIKINSCEKLVHFDPTIGLSPDTSFSDTPAGLSAVVRVPQGLNPEGLATPGLKETTVTLPEGIAINPGQATGLAACQPSQTGLPTLEGLSAAEGEKEIYDGPPSCPAASKVGTDEIATPLLPKRLKGNVYVLGDNPPNLKLLVAAEGEGIYLKLIGTVHLNEQTGQLVTTFNGTPQDPGTPDAPLNEFVLNFSGGAQAALVTPMTCGAYKSTVDFTPWSTPLTEDALDESSFQITAGPAGTGSCTNPLPFQPAMTAGSTTDQAGGYTGFSMLLQRGDGQQRIDNLSFTTPEGLLGMIAKIPLCDETDANAGICPAASQIGHTVVGAGPGPYPLFIPQQNAPPAPIYLTGPYKGSPFGLSIVVPLVAGPFNLGTQVVRAQIAVDRHTSQITVITDPLPTIEKGIPADLRSIDAVIDRPEFMFNPTDCSPMSFSGTATSTEGETVPLGSHFQMGSCQALKFQPNFKVSTSGKTSRKNGASLTAKIVYPVGNLGSNQASSQSNIQAVKVDLPKQLPSRLPTLQKACTAKQFDTNPAGCPEASKVGHAKVITPVLPVPLEGPAYFVSHGGEAFPNLIIVLQGYGVTIDLVGDTFINEKTNITSSTFKQVPDVPIQSFELTLPQGPYSALAANTNLCTVKGGLHMPTNFTAQNGAVIHQITPITTIGCPKAKATKHKNRHRKKK